MNIFHSFQLALPTSRGNPKTDEETREFSPISLLRFLTYLHVRTYYSSSLVPLELGR
jgi:hypothetical protein